MLKHNSLPATKNKYLQVSVDELVWMDVFHSTDNFIKYFMDFHRGSLFVRTISRPYPLSQCSSLAELHLNKQICPAAETHRERTGMTLGWIFNITLYCIKGVISYFIISYNTFRIIILFFFRSLLILLVNASFLWPLKWNKYCNQTNHSFEKHYILVVVVTDYMLQPSITYVLHVYLSLCTFIYKYCTKYFCNTLV